MTHFPIIQALCRSALVNPSSAVVQQVERLRKALEKDGMDKEAKLLESMLTQVGKASDMAPSRIVHAKFSTGEDLSEKTPIPVDKETSTPLAEIIFPNKLPEDSPLFNATVETAIESILNEWNNFDKLTSIGAQPSRSCLIYGEPGTGKTHLAMWLAKQINLPIVLVKLDGLISSFLGTTSRNIGNLFSFANKYRCLLLLDEFDAIAKLRNDPQEVGEIKRVVNTLLQNLDSRQNIGFTIGVTNHETLLDPAIWRRFDIQIEIPKPSDDVLNKLLIKFINPLELNDIELKFLTWLMEGVSGSDVENLANWLKKSSVISPNQNTVDLVKKFATLNSGRISADKRELLLKGTEDDLLSSLLQSKISLKQKELAQLFGIHTSTLSRTISKSKL